MSEQNYCMVNAQNICDNVVVWDGNPNTWTPPVDYTMLPQATTPTKQWSWNATSSIWELTPSTNLGDIGYTWDGTYLVTNQPAPVLESAKVSLAQPLSSGTKTV